MLSMDVEHKKNIKVALKKLGAIEQSFSERRVKTDFGRYEISIYCCSRGECSASLYVSGHRKRIDAISFRALNEKHVLRQLKRLLKEDNLKEVERCLDDHAKRQDEELLKEKICLGAGLKPHSYRSWSGRGLVVDVVGDYYDIKIRIEGHDKFAQRINQIASITDES